MRTLVDCGCVARVHGDGSGIEIDYCTTHEAAPDLLAACKLVLNLPAPIDRQIVEERLKTAIAKAEGR